jgi:hypothetical protein
MFKMMKNTWSTWCKKGMYLPYAHDPVSKKPSITLLFPYLTFALAFISVILLHIWPSMVIATGTSLIFWVIAVVLYLLRKLQKAKFDIDDGSFELESKSGS